MILSPWFRGLNHERATDLNAATIPIGMSGFGSKAEIFCLIRALHEVGALWESAPSWLLSQIADCPGRTASRRDVPFRTRSGPARDVALPQLGNDNVNIKHCREVSRIG